MPNPHQESFDLARRELVTVRDLDVDMDLGNNGVILEVRDNDDGFLGKLRVGRATVEWCTGKTRIGNGYQVSWKDLITYFES